MRANLLQEGSLLLVQFNEMRENVGMKRAFLTLCAVLVSITACNIQKQAASSKAQSSVHPIW